VDQIVHRSSDTQIIFTPVADRYVELGGWKLCTLKETVVDEAACCRCFEVFWWPEVCRSVKGVDLHQGYPTSTKRFDPRGAADSTA
jgi:hypothetical protein